ncbi:aminodeoxychorismate/anthranilate synthase component II [Cryomorpha ignava]|uniref:Aminodeoxychorismate/anthranilate synthase component II n=1 Tax=Cryomorpha ignava TaxID=101383 RepID=A0A7K3WJU0_9FLAO|nr:aminodeoxychorismate/anthranilate synthase component II [Cryomorpha ignava]NEN21913.1 aminodeoxychorismate/anthranilate synthase component II [Cryomorpha ignava]
MLSSKTLIVDNYDSFTFNLLHIIEAILNEDVEVKRVDEIDRQDLAAFHTIVFSPGPGLPDESTNLLNIMRESMRLEKRILGVCLGLQAMAVAEGAELKNLETVHHGVSEQIHISHPDSILYQNCSVDPFIGRYHSWVVNEEKLPTCWIITSRDKHGEVMSMEHSTKPFYGIQFHPESVLTPEGRAILKGFIEG